MLTMPKPPLFSDFFCFDTNYFTAPFFSTIGVCARVVWYDASCNVEGRTRWERPLDDTEGKKREFEGWRRTVRKRAREQRTLAGERERRRGGGASMSPGRRGAHLAAQVSLLRQGSLVGRESRPSAFRTPERRVAAGALAFERAASGSSVDLDDTGGGRRGMHYNTANNRDIAKERPPARVGSSTSDSLRRPNSMNRKEFVELSREAGGGLTWAEQFMLKRKRLQESP